MKFCSFFLILLLIISCKETPEFGMEIKTLQTNLSKENNEYLKNYHPDRIGQKIQIQFVKNEKNNKTYGIMSCSYGDNFITDSKDFVIQINNCDSNYPSWLEFQNNRSTKYKFIVAKNPNSTVKYFKIGYKKIIIPKDSDVIDSYNEQFENKKYEILWSKPIKFE